MNSLAPHLKAKALKPNSRRPAKELCSECGLCDTYYIHYVKEACAFLNQQIADLEAAAHGKSRDLNQENDLYFGVHQEMMAAKKKQAIPGAQWTGIVSTIACEMLNRGLVEGVVCVQNTAEDRFQPQPILARTTEEILAAKVNKPTLSPNLSVLEEIEKSGMKRLLVIGVGCQIQALRAVEKKLGFKHEDGSMEMVPFFGLKTNKLKDVFAPSCMTCFDYVNSLADLVVGYMGAPFGWQWIMVRNDTGKEMLELVKDQLDTQDVMSSGDRKQAVQNSIPAYDKGVTLPMWAAKMMGVVIEKIGPKGLEYARFSIDSHFTRNYLYVKRNYPEKLAAHVPEYAKKIVEQYKLPD